MGLEQYKNQEENITPVAVIASGFRELTHENLDTSLFSELEESLNFAGYEIAENNEAFAVLHDNSLLCRSENFTQVMGLIQQQTPIILENETGSANMCTMSGSDGYRTAMVEGFSGDDVKNALKVVVTFTGENLTSRTAIDPNSDLWKFKEKTAEVSIAGRGQISSDEVRMISFRFPAHLFPKTMLTDSEDERNQDHEIKFIVRHYIQKKVLH